MGLGIEAHGHVNGLLFFVEGLVDRDVPFPGGQQVSDVLVELLGIAGIVGYPATQFPRIHQARRGASVETLDFELAHLVHIAFVHLQLVTDRGLRTRSTGGLSGRMLMVRTR